MTNINFTKLYCFYLNKCICTSFGQIMTSYVSAEHKTNINQINYQWRNNDKLRDNLSFLFGKKVPPQAT